MKVKFTDLKRLHDSMKRELGNAIERVMQSGRFIKGDELKNFEKEFAAFCNARFCIGCDSGTAALHTALMALEIGAGDEVITVSHTFIATAEAITHAGATPVFVDIDEDTYLIDPQKIEEKITDKTRAIIVVHLYGQPVEMDTVTAIARQHELMIIEDAAQAVGAKYKGKAVGTLGDVGCFSFFPAKNLGACGDAGALVTNHPAIAEKAAMLVNHGRKEKFVNDLVGYNYRMDELQAAILRAKLPHVVSWNELRRSAVLNYKNAFKEKSGLLHLVRLPKEYPGTYGVFHLFVVQVPDRDGLRSFLDDKGVETGIHYPVPVHLQPAFAHLPYPEGSLPVTEKICSHILSLPLDPFITPEEIHYVVDCIAEYHS